MTLEYGKAAGEGTCKVIIACALVFNAITYVQPMKLKDALEMVKLAQSEAGENDTMTNALMKTMEEAKRVSEISGNDNGIEESFIQKVKDIVKASGIDVILPLDCGRNPSHPESPLASTSAPFPWVAALGSRIDGIFYFLCTGVVISESHVLTDGNCAASPVINMVRMNVTSLPGKDDGVDNYVVGRRIHPSVRTKKDFFNGANIGLLELAFPFKFNDLVQPICLPGILDDDSQDQFKSFRTTLVGFRNIKDSGRNVRTGNLFINSNSTTDYAPQCASMIKLFNRLNPEEFSTLDKRLTEDHICVYRNFDEVGKSLAVMEEKDATGLPRMKLIGAGGIVNSHDTNTIAFSRLQSHRFWIDLVVKKFQDNTADVKKRQRG